MAFQLLINSTNIKCSNVLFLVMKLCFLIICFLQSAIGAGTPLETINIGAIIDVDSRAGKEQKTAMLVAVQSFNSISTNHKLTIHFRNTSNYPIHAVSAAEELITQKQVQVIIGMQTWEQAVLVADVRKKAQVPVLSLAPAPNRHLFIQHRWPFLVPTVSDGFEQISCIASIIRSYHWRKVVAVYEDNTYGGDSEMLAILSEALQPVDAEIEAHLVLPPMSSVSDPEGIVREEVEKLLMTQSRVFVVLRSSLSLANHLFREARKLGLMGRDSVWIIADTLSNLLDSVDTNFISSAQGALGTKLYYSEEATPFLDFRRQFQKVFRLEFPSEHNLEPGIYALQAYDGITAISKVVMELGSKSNTSTSMLLPTIIRSNNFTGLTGDIHFHNESLSSPPMFRIVNVVGKSYKELGFWSSSFNFADSLELENGKINFSAVDGVQTMQNMTARVNWPGELDRIPKGWAMPSNANPMKIGVPGRTVFQKFVKVDWVDNDKNGERKYDGFCIDIFEEILKLLEQEYALPYEFYPYNGSYDQLVDHVINRSFDAVVGDVTILAERSNDVDFTQPYAESGLSMLVPVKNEAQMPWMFVKPFTRNMWIATFSIMFYTMIVVWYIEHQTNEQFKGPRKDQLVTAIGFTFSTLFFAHRENIRSNSTKAVVMMWLFLVFVVTSSYQAALTSILTVPRLEPRTTDVQWVRKTNAAVGCDGDSFVRDYLQNVLQLRNIKTIDNEDAYPAEFESGNITAAFLELPYQKVFLGEYCNEYTAVGPTYRNGGLGFVFQKGSPIARDFSKAILTLQENGKLRSLVEEWLESSMNCSSVDESGNPESLRFESFWVLYLISGSTSTFCFVYFITKRCWKRQEAYQNGAIVGDKGIKGIVDMVVELGPYLRRRSMGRDGTFAQRWSSSRWGLVSPTDPSEHFEAAP
ncbi:glutamate receptor 2.7 [Coffea arabica]|uniref:Glutamate receptor n=1 Tax=Coffea arabica TaxID=13443 RepID=A0A6P6VSH0_COFAR